jgi:hypothetical protein
MATDKERVASTTPKMGIRAPIGLVRQNYLRR